MPTILDVSSASPLADGQLQGLLAGLLPRVLVRRGELLAIKDLVSGRYVHANEAMADFLRRPLTEVLATATPSCSTRPSPLPCALPSRQRWARANR